MMKKAYGWFLFGLLLCAVLVIGLLPGTAKATDYDLWIGGVQVTDDHLWELDSNGNGWSYAPETEANPIATLTLKNFTCDVTDTAAIKNSGSVSYQLTIILEGKNTIRSGENYDGIDLRAVAGARLYIDGYGSLSVTGGRNGINAGDLEIIGGYLSVYGGTGYGVAGAVHIEREAKYLEITGNNPQAVERYFEIAENITGIGWENADGTGTVTDIRIPDNYQGAPHYRFDSITYKKRSLCQGASSGSAARK